MAVLCPGADFDVRRSINSGVPLNVPWLIARADGAGYWKTVADAYGTVEISSYSGGLALLGAAGDSPSFVFGPHAEVGWASAKGVPNQPNLAGHTGGQVLATMSLVVGTRVALRGPWALAFELESGSTLSGLNVYADQRTLAIIGGAFATARGGIAFGP